MNAGLNMENQAKKILVVEDDESISKMLVERLNKEGFEVLTAKDGEEGLKTALEKHPDAIILDLMLPKMHGKVVLHKLREDGWGEDVPVIILTNFDPDDNMIEHVVEDEPSYYLLKSGMSLDEIVEKINNLLTPPVENTSL